MTPQTLSLTDPARRAYDGEHDRPIRVELWRADRADAPLVVLSHGTGGAARGLAWWSGALRDAGFDVAAVDHHGNNHVDGYLAEGFACWWDRARDVSAVLDQVEARGPVGACGFSLGGYTAAAVCGARISRELFLAVVSGAVPTPPTPEYPTVREELLARYGAGAAAEWSAYAAADLRDERVRAAFLLCPSLGLLVTEESLAAVDVPVAVRWTESDDIAPPDANGRRYASLVPGADGAAVGTPGSGHYGFVLPEHDDPRAKADVVAASIAHFTATLG